MHLGVNDKHAVSQPLAGGKTSAAAAAAAATVRAVQTSPWSSLESIQESEEGEEVERRRQASRTPEAAAPEDAAHDSREQLPGGSSASDGSEDEEPHVELASQASSEVLALAAATEGHDQDKCTSMEQSSVLEMQSSIAPVLGMGLTRLASLLPRRDMRISSGSTGGGDGDGGSPSSGSSAGQKPAGGLRAAFAGASSLGRFPSTAWLR
jgi:hypothetical protein